jgi:UDP-N-acetylglucosamine/UDP-N-acetylgalactosamine diphosphorylase
MAVLEVPREDEFSPLKNSPGCKDGFSPETSRTDIIAQHLRFVKAAGATIQGDGSLEISPLVSYAGEGLEVLKGVTIKTPKLIETEDELKALASQ